MWNQSSEQLNEKVSRFPMSSYLDFLKDSLPWLGRYHFRFWASSNVGLSFWFLLYSFTKPEKRKLWQDSLCHLLMNQRRMAWICSHHGKTLEFHPMETQGMEKSTKCLHHEQYESSSKGKNCEAPPSGWQCYFTCNSHQKVILLLKQTYFSIKYITRECMCFFPF